VFLKSRHFHPNSNGEMARLINQTNFAENDTTVHEVKSTSANQSLSQISADSSKIDNNGLVLLLPLHSFFGILHL